MGKIFGQHLREQRDRVGMSRYKLAQLSGLDGGNLGAFEAGTKPPSVAAVELIAAVEALQLDRETLLLWLDLDKLGEDGLERVRRYLAGSEMFSASPSRSTGTRGS